MELSVPTLQITDFLVFTSCGAIFICNWLLHRQKTYFLLFGASFLVCAAMSVWFVDFGFYGSVWSPLGWTLAGSAFWCGLRLFDGRSPITRWMIYLAVLPSGTHAVLALAGFDSGTINSASTIAYAVHEAAIAHYAFSNSQGSPIRKLIGSALLAIPLAICMPLLPLANEQVPIILIFVVDHITSIVLTTSILALEAEKAYAIVERAARLDPLTGALNREGLAAKAGSDLYNAGIIVVDLDHFKSINDRFGHAGGDEVLREFAKRAGDIVPNGCHLARLGGEEFVIVLPGRDHNATTYLAERVRHAIGSVPIAWKTSTIQVTASVGVSVLASGEALHDAMERADKALYEAKIGGRNQVRTA